MHRRSVLACVAVTLSGLAGCLGDSGESDQDQTSTPTQTPDFDVEVTGIQYRTAVLYPTHPDAAAVFTSGGGQFVFLVVETDSEVSLHEFALRVRGDEDEHTTAVDTGLLNRVFNEGWMADSALPALPYEDGSGLLGFSVRHDVGAVEAVELVVETDAGTREWPFPAEKARELDESPVFDVSLNLPDEVIWESEFDADLAIRNDGGRDGQFVAIFGVESAQHPRTVSVTVPQGSSKSESIGVEFPSPFESRPDEPPDSVTYTLDWGSAVIEETIPVVA